MMQSAKEDTVKILVKSGAVSNVTIVTSKSDGEKKRFSILLKIGDDELSVASKRESIRRWASLDTVSDWLHEMGVLNAVLKV